MLITKLYWVLCGAIFIFGAGVALVTSGLHDTTVSGEMPLAFGVGVIIALLAIVGFVVGAIVKVVFAAINKK